MTSDIRQDDGLGTRAPSLHGEARDPGERCGRDGRAPREGWRSRRYLPHFDGRNVIQTVTFRLHDSQPADVVARWQGEVDSDAARRELIARYEDQGHGACWMKVPSIADAVQRALLFFDGKRYGLCAWCVMPNHVHAMVQTFDRFSLETVVHSWKSFSAHKANRILQRTGRFWQPEYHDRYVRDARHFRAAVAYIENNPVKAGLTASPDTWPWSSALCPPGSAGVTPACPIAFDE